VAYTFSGTAKTITLPPGTVTLDLIDLYSRWKDWVLAGNAQHAIAFRAVGGDIPAIPLYLFLLNGWRLIPQSANHVLTVMAGVLEVDGGGEPFNDPAGSYKIRINRETPGIAIGYSSAGGSAPSAGQVADAVWAKVLEGPLTAEQIQRIVLSAMAGETSGLGTGNEHYLAQDGNKIRIDAIFDATSNRTSVTLDGTA